MKKLLVTAALCIFASLIYAAPAKAAAKEQVILPGALSIHVPAKPPKNLIGKEWIKHWGLAGNAVIEKGKILFKNATIYGYHVHPAKEARKYTITVKFAAVPGAKIVRAGGYFSTCVRKIGDKRPFGHEKRTSFGPFAVTAQEKEYKVEYIAEAFEQGYFYLSGENVLNSFIRIVSSPVAK